MSNVIRIAKNRVYSYVKCKLSLNVKLLFSSLKFASINQNESVCHRYPVELVSLLYVCTAYSATCGSMDLAPILCFLRVRKKSASPQLCYC